jgi:hypothetical protein
MRKERENKIKRYESLYNKEKNLISNENHILFKYYLKKFNAFSEIGT